MKAIKKSLTRNQCLDALVCLDATTDVPKRLHRFITDKYFWNSDRRFTSKRLVDLLLILHNNGWFRTGLEKDVFDAYLERLDILSNGDKYEPRTQSYEDFLNQYFNN